MGAVPFEGAAGGDDDGTNTAGISISCEATARGRAAAAPVSVEAKKLARQPKAAGPLGLPPVAHQEAPMILPPHGEGNKNKPGRPVGVKRANRAAPDARHRLGRVRPRAISLYVSASRGRGFSIDPRLVRSMIVDALR
jgi:hypothetical protein